MLGFLSLLGRKHSKKKKSCACGNSCTKSVKSRKERDLRIENLEQRQLLSITWNGHGNNNHWSNGANWVGGVAPTANADLVFSGTTQTATENDLSYTFHSLTVSTSNFSVSGNPVALNGNLTLGSSVAGTSIPTGIGFSGSNSTVTLGSGANLSVGGVSGTSGLTLTTGSSSSLTVDGGVSVQGALTVTEGSSANFSVSGNVSATGNLTLTEGTSASFTVAGIISGTGNVAITEGSSASLSLGGINDTGTLTLTEGSNATATIGGIISGLSGITWNVGTGANATLSGDVSGTGGLTKTGPGTLNLSGHNSFSGTTTISTGTLKLTASDALAGSTLAYTSTGGTLDLGTLTSVALGGLSGNKNLSLTNNAGQAIALSVGGDNASTSYSGVLSGLGGLTKTGDGALTLAGASANTFIGMTTVNAGKLVLGKSAGQHAIGGDLTICPSGGWGDATNGVELAANEQLPNAAVLHFTGSDWSGFRLKGFTETVAGLDSPSGMGVIENYGMNETGPANDGTLIVNTPSGGDYAFNGYVRDNDGGSTKIHLTKTGLGRQALIGENIAYSGGTTLYAGTLRLQRTTGFQSAVTNSGIVELYSDDDFANRGNSIFYQPFQVIGGVINKTGPGEVRFAQAVVMSGQLNILAGVLGNDCLSADWSADTANVNIGSGAFLDLRGQPITVNALTGAGTVENTFNTGDANALTVGVNGSGGTFSGVILGSGQGTDDGDANMGITSLVKTGSGTLTLASSDSTFAGDLRVAGGTLKFDDVNALANATLDWNNYGGTLDLGHFTALTLGGLKGSQNFAMVNDLGQPITLTLGSGDYSGVLSGGGSLVKSGPGTLRLGGSTGNTYTGSTTFLDGYLELAKTSGYAIPGNLSLGGAGDSWVKLLGDDQIAPTVQLVWTYTGGSHEIDLLGHDLTVAGISDTHGWGVIANTWDETGDYGDATFTLLNSADCSFNGYCRGSFLGDGTITVVKDGPGTLTLGSPNFDNTFTDDLKIAGGTVRLGDANALAHIMLDHNNFGGTLDLGNFTTIALGGLKGSQNFPLVNGLGQPVALSVGRGDYAGVFSGAGSLTKTGDGILTLTGQNIYTGGTIIAGGALQLGDGTSSNGSVVGDITDNANLIFDVSVDRIYSDVISGKGDLTKIGSGALTLTGANSYSGATIIEEGTLCVGDGEANGSLGTGPVIDNSYLVYITSSPSSASVLGIGHLTLIGSGAFTLNTPGAPSVAIHDPNNHIISGGMVSVTAPTVIAGMPLTLTAAVADLYGDCLGVTFYRDANQNGQLDSADTLLGEGVHDGYGYWSTTISTTGWGPTADAVFAEADFQENSQHPPAATLAAGHINVTADAAMVSSSLNNPVYHESGSGFSTVYSSLAYGGQSRVMSGTDSNAYATYTFTGLIAGNYEIWKNFAAGSQYSKNVTIEVFDGDPSTGALQQTFTIDETTSDDWSNWEVSGATWSWSGGYFSSNSGTITVRISAADGPLSVPAIRLIADPIIKSPYAPCGSASKDPVDYVTGKTQYCGCAGPLPKGAAYDNTDAGNIHDTGYGENDAYTPRMWGSGMLVNVQGVPWDIALNQNRPGTGSTCDAFPTETGIEPIRHYDMLFGSKSTLEDDGTCLTYTREDGSWFKFSYPDTGGFYAIGTWMESGYAGGQGIKVTQWTDGQGDSGTHVSDDYTATCNKKRVVKYYESGSTTPCQTETYTYTPVGTFYLCDSVTYQRRDTAASVSDLVNDRKVLYEYYTADGTNGSIGDLKTVTTKYWDETSWNTTVTPNSYGNWAGGDTIYNRYYTASSADGFQHGLMRQLLPAAYAKACSDFSLTDLGGLNDTQIAPYTCFYYKYDSNHRVNFEEVYGQLRQTTYEFQTGYSPGNQTPPNATLWTMQTTEHRADGSTYIVYSNYMGETMATDLTDPVSEQHTYTYKQYDANGHLTLDVQPAALSDLSVNYSAHTITPVASSSGGLVNVYTYSTTTTATDESTPGEVANYLKSAGVADSVADALAYLNDPVTYPITKVRDYSYFRHNAGTTESPSYVYHLAGQTQYPDTGGTGGVTTGYSNNLSWSGKQIRYEKLNLPAVDPTQNGSGEPDYTETTYDEQGRVSLTRDARGVCTSYGYYSATNLLEYSIADCYVLQLQTNYFYDVRGRLTQTLGPAHLATIPNSSSLVSVRTASWTVYDDANHLIYSLSGYAKETSSNNDDWSIFTVANPVSISIATKDGQVTDQIQAVLVEDGSHVVSWRASTSADAPDFIDLTGTLTTPHDLFLGKKISSTTITDGIGLPPSTHAAYTAWIHYIYSHKQLWKAQVYHAIPSSGTGDPGTNYEETEYGYDSVGRLQWTETPAGTFTWNQFDARGKILSTWMGTDMTPNSGTFSTTNTAGTNMVEISSSTYDADGNRLTTTQYPGGGASNLTTTYKYDFRDRLVYTMQPSSTFTMNYYDNLGRVVKQQSYYDSDHDYGTNGPQTIVYNSNGTIDYGDDRLLSQSTAAYDARGRVYETDVYNVNPTTGHIDVTDGVQDGHYLPTYTWYDEAGNVIKTETGTTGAFTKTTYDALGRPTVQYIGYDENEPIENEYTWDAASMVDSNDTILQQSQTWYDAAGEAVATASFQRFANDTSGTGPLFAYNYIYNAYATASAVWYDGVGRQIETVNYGREDTNSTYTPNGFFDTNGYLVDNDSTGLPDLAESAAPAQPTSDSYIVAQTAYDAAGRAYKTTDNLGRDNVTIYDAADRTVMTIQNYLADGFVDQIPPVATDTIAEVAAKIKETSRDKDITVKYDYDTKGRLVAMTAFNAKGDDHTANHNVESQTTKYLYDDSATSINASWQTAVVYPDSTDNVSGPDANGDWTITSGNDHVSITYDRLGRVHSTMDQNNTSLAASLQRGVTHTYTYGANGTSAAGKVVLDSVTIPTGSTGVDQTVLSIGTTYDDLGRVKKVTSYQYGDGTGTIRNEIQEVYDGWGNLVCEYQAHDGAVSISSPVTPSVQYTYADGADGSKAAYVRLDSVTYPSDGHTVGYNYGTTGSPDDILSRVFALTDGSGQNAPHFAEYTYLGADQVVKTAHPQVFDGLNLDFGAADNLDGLDRFGRVVDQVWADNSNNAVDEYQYGFDRAGNVAWKQNAKAVGQALDELYTCDDLDRLADTKRGTLNMGTNPPTIATPTKTQDWTLDGLGNFGIFNDDGAEQTREVNAANEIIDSDDIATPTYDAAGNMISDGTRKYKFDAWNRQVEVSKANDTLLATYEFDGRNRRIEKIVTQAGGGDSTGTTTDYLYNTNRQVLEERKTVPSQQAPAVTQYVWDLSYIDTPVVRRHDQNGNGDFVDSGDSVLYYTTDRNHNITSVVDPTTGDPVERYVYDAYGQVTFRDADWDLLTTGGLNTQERSGVSSASDIGNEILYCGYRYDPETAVAISGTVVTPGNSHVRAREYITQFSTFGSRDPIGYQAGMNLYRYVNNSPLTRIDPTGLDPANAGYYNPFFITYTTCTYTGAYQIHETIHALPLIGYISTTFSCDCKEDCVVYKCYLGTSGYYTQDNNDSYSDYDENTYSFTWSDSDGPYGMQTAQIRMWFEKKCAQTCHKNTLID